MQRMTKYVIFKYLKDLALLPQIIKIGFSQNSASSRISLKEVPL